MGCVSIVKRSFRKDHQKNIIRPQTSQTPHMCDMSAIATSWMISQNPNHPLKASISALPTPLVTKLSLFPRFIAPHPTSSWVWLYSECQAADALGVLPLLGTGTFRTQRAQRAIRRLRLPRHGRSRLTTRSSTAPERQKERTRSRLPRFLTNGPRRTLLEGVFRPVFVGLGEPRGVCSGKDLVECVRDWPQKGWG